MCSIRDVDIATPRHSVDTHPDAHSAQPADKLWSHARKSGVFDIGLARSEIQSYGTVSHMLPLELEEPVRLEMTEQLNQLLADAMTLRDLYKKSHWQVGGPQNSYQEHWAT